MTTPRGTYGGGYYAPSVFPDTPIYDRLVAERGTPQIAPIRVTPQYDMGNSLPAFPALPALPSASTPFTAQHGTYTGYTPAPQPAAYPPQPAPAAYIPQQASGPRDYPGSYSQHTPQTPYQGGQMGYDAVRPVPPRPVPPRPVPPRPVPPRPAPPRPSAPGGPYGDNQYRRPYNGQGY